MHVAAIRAGSANVLHAKREREEREAAARAASAATAAARSDPASTSAGAPPQEHGVLVQLNVYDITNTSSERINSSIVNLNKFTRDMVGIGGVFHGGVEVHGEEWSYGYCDRGSGVYCCRPKANTMYTLRETIPLGVTALDPTRVRQIVWQLQTEWAGNAYHLLAHNCNHFCDELAKRLGVGPIPAWVNRLAVAADLTVEFSNSTYSTLRQVGQEVTEAWNSTVTSVKTFFVGAGAGEGSGAGEASGADATGNGNATAPGGQRLGGAAPTLSPREQLQALHGGGGAAAVPSPPPPGPPLEERRL